VVVAAPGHVGPGLPPILIVHGDSDTLVPLEQSQRFAARAAELGRPVELVVRPGKGHGWLTMLWDVRLFADWFDRHLLPPRAALPAGL
jgi:dipeptidyl aminopeptidase/acylaminoacyl peptidase